MVFIAILRGAQKWERLESEISTKMMQEQGQKLHQAKKKKKNLIRPNGTKQGRGVRAAAEMAMGGMMKSPFCFKQHHIKKRKKEQKSKPYN